MHMTDNTLNADFDIYKIELMNGVYNEPQKLDDNVNSSHMEINAFIDPDENYLIFGSTRPGGFGSSDLYICYKQENDSWSPAVNMGEPINSELSEGSPFVSFDGSYLFFLSDRAQMYNRNPYWVNTEAIEGFTTGINIFDDPIKNKKGISLNQNYPNPFSNSTKMSFQLSEPFKVIMKLYNIHGEELVSMIDRKMPAGKHDIRLNLTDYSDGIYLVVVEAGNYSEIKKLVLRK